MRYLLLPLLLAGCDSSDPLDPGPGGLDLSGVYAINGDEGTATWTLAGAEVTLTVEDFETGTGALIDGAMQGTHFATTNDMTLTGTHTHAAFGHTGPARFEGVVSLGGARVEGQWCRDYTIEPGWTECNDLVLTRD